MEFRHLSAFIAISEELHFGRAAARLHMTQPSLSAQLQKLEKSLGVQLVARTSREVTLTRAGREFVEQAKIIVSQMENAARMVKVTASGHAQALTVGYNFPASRHVLPRVLTRMNDEHPDVVISLVEMRTGPQLDALAQGAIDVALVYGHPSTGDFRFRRVLRGVPLVAVVGAQHQWAGRSRVPFAELATQSCVMFAREQCPAMYDSIHAAAADNKIVLDVAQTANDPGATAHVVSIKPLVGFASLSRASSAGMGTVGARSVAVDLIDPVPTLDLYSVWRQGEDNPAVELFMNCLDSGRGITSART